MKHFLILFMLCVVSFGCRTGKPPGTSISSAEIRERVVEKLVPYRLPADSAQFYALLACDSLNNVILQEVSEWKGKNMQSEFSLKENALLYRVVEKSDTIYILAKDSIRYEQIPYKVEVPVEVNQLTRYQSFQVKAAIITELLILGWLASKLNWKNIIKSITNIIKFK